MEKYIGIIVQFINDKYLVYWALLVWGVFSSFWIWKVLKKGTKSVNQYFYDNIPNLFTVLGVLGTFCGIYAGLQNFKSEDIENSIPPLLEGLKTAFGTSIFGIILSIVFKKISQGVWHNAEKKQGDTSTGDPTLDALIEIKTHLKPLTILGKIKKHLEPLKKLEILGEIKTALGGDGDSSLLTQIQKLRNEQRDIASETKDNIKWIVQSMKENNALIAKKFEEFSKLLQESNTEALVKAMEKSTEKFHAKMEEVLDRLVKKNFEKLNESVQNMISWQKDNKEMIETLTNTFKNVVDDFETSSESIKEISENTKELTDENSKLKTLIEQLRKVMVDDTKYQDIVNKVTNTIEILKENTTAFDNTTNKLNDWVKKQMDFSDSVAKLLTRLEKIEKIKDINEVFWKNTKEQLNEGVSLIKNSSTQISGDLDNINGQFSEILNTAFTQFGNAIERAIQGYEEGRNNRNRY